MELNARPAADPALNRLLVDRIMGRPASAPAPARSADPWASFPDAPAPAPVKAADPYAGFPDAPQAPAAPAPSRVINFEGRRISVPGDATDDEVGQILNTPAPAASQAIEIDAPDGSIVEFPAGTSDDVMTKAMRAKFGGPAVGDPGPALPAEAGGFMSTVGGMAKAGAQGVVQGANMLLDAPVQAVNQAPRLLNINGALVNKIMGREVVPSFGPISDNPLLPSDILQAGPRAAGAREYQPQGPVERVVNRVGQEVGASAIPAAGALVAGGRMGVQGARALATSKNPLAALAYGPVEAAAANPSGMVAREALGAGAAGTGAGIANEAARAITGDDVNPISDLAGSAAGVSALAIARPILGAVGSLASAARGSTRFADDVAREAVAHEIIANSGHAQAQVAGGIDRGAIDAQPLADQLRRTSAAESTIPGYRSDIADRSGDPGLAAYVFGHTAANPGLDTVRRAANQQAIGDRMAEIAPTGSPGQFRADLQGGVDRRVTAAESQAEIAQRTLDEHTQRLTATMTGEARGADIRAALQRAADEAKQGVRQAYEPINKATADVDVAPLAERFSGIDEGLSMAERQRFRPAEAAIPDRLIGPAEATGPVDTGILDASGRPITREPAPGNSQQPLREVTGLRSALTDDARAARTANRPAEARIIDQHVTALDSYLDEAVPEGLRGQYDVAKAARRDVADRFERPQNAVSQVLGERQGVYNVPDSGVAPRFAQSDEGRLTDLRQLMSEAGGDAGVRPALRDQFLANIRDRGLLDRPDQLNAYLDRHATLLDQLPGLRDELSAGGAASRVSAEARGAADTTRRDLTTPGRSPEAAYLRYDEAGTVRSMRTVLGAAKPAEAAERLLATAGTNPEHARAAFWEALKDRAIVDGGVNQPKQISGRRGNDFLNDPQTKAVAEVLYRDKPEQLRDITDVFDALAGSNSATRARRPGSSGTAQGMRAGYDAALSAASISSRIRSVHRGQLSPTIAGIDLLATYLRRKSAQIQSGTISRLRDEVVQNPELAARLLEDYNPATYSAKRRELQTAFGARATTAIRLFDEAHDEEERPGVAAVQRGVR